MKKYSDFIILIQLDFITFTNTFKSQVIKFNRDFSKQDVI